MNNPMLKERRRISPAARESWKRNLLRVREMPDAQEKLRQHLTGKSNPFHKPEVRQKSLETMSKKGFGHLNGGNGKVLPVPVRMLSERLGWPTEVIVPCGPRVSAKGNPTYFRIDIADPVLKIAVEADGMSHKLAAIKESDRRKEAFLASKGWTLLRFWNRRILTDFENVVAEIMEVAKSLTSKQAPATTSQTHS